MLGFELAPRNWKNAWQVIENPTCEDSSGGLEFLDAHGRLSDLDLFFCVFFFSGVFLFFNSDVFFVFCFSNKVEKR